MIYRRNQLCTRSLEQQTTSSVLQGNRCGERDPSLYLGLNAIGPSAGESPEGEFWALRLSLIARVTKVGPW